VDDESYARAMELACEIDQCQENIAARAEVLGLGDIFEGDACACRCASELPHAEEGSRQLASCAVDPHVHGGRAVCAPAAAASLAGEGGSQDVTELACPRAFRTEGGTTLVACTLGQDTCQLYGAGTSAEKGICAPFIAPETSIFVPAGETIESLEGDIKALLFEAASFLPSFLPSLPSFLPFLPSFPFLLPLLFLDSFLPSFHSSFLPSSKCPSLPSFLPSFLPLSFPSFPPFLPSSKFPSFPSFL
jgi:hypothetical protein